MRQLPLSLVGSFFVCSSCALAQSGGDWLGSERGPFDTGTFTEVWIDEDRDESLTDTPRDQRHLTIQIWYPADPRANAPRAAYAPNVDAYDEFTQQSLMEAARRPTSSVVDADIADQDSRFPVILYSHGSGIASFSGTS